MSKGENLKHDEFCFAEMSEKDISSDLVQNVVDDDLLEILDLTTIKVTSESHIDGKLRKTRSDVIIEVKIKEDSEGVKKILEKEGPRVEMKDDVLKLIFLVEHKSTKERLSLMQLLKYLVNIWCKDMEEGRELTPIIPILLYHGETEWNEADNLEMCFHWFARRILGDFIPYFKYVCLDVSKIDISKLKGGPRLKMFFQILQESHGDLKKGFEKAIDILNNGLRGRSVPSGVDRDLSNIIEYVSRSSKVSPESLDMIIDKIEIPELEEKAMTLAEKLEERGFAKGRLEGERTGRLEGERTGRLEEKMYTAINLKHMGVNAEFIIAATGLSRQEVEDILLDPTL